MWCCKAIPIFAISCLKPHEISFEISSKLSAMALLLHVNGGSSSFSCFFFFFLISIIVVDDGLLVSNWMLLLICCNFLIRSCNLVIGLKDDMEIIVSLSSIAGGFFFFICCCCCISCRPAFAIDFVIVIVYYCKIVATICIVSQYNRKLENCLFSWGFTHHRYAQRNRTNFLYPFSTQSRKEWGFSGVMLRGRAKWRHS